MLGLMREYSEDASNTHVMAAGLEHGRTGKQWNWREDNGPGYGYMMLTITRGYTILLKQSVKDIDSITVRFCIQIFCTDDYGITKLWSTLFRLYTPHILSCSTRRFFRH